MPLLCQHHSSQFSFSRHMGSKLQTFVNRGSYTTLNKETDLFAYSRLLTELLPSRPTYLSASPINRPLIHVYIIVAHSVKQGNKKSVRQASSHIPFFGVVRENVP
jgi:hypothetical protein